MEDTYAVPKHGWTCFHCGVTFIDEHSARAHFGVTPNSDAGCVLKLEGKDRGLLKKVREQEIDIEKLRLENEQLDYEASFTV